MKKAIKKKAVVAEEPVVVPEAIIPEEKYGARMSSAKVCAFCKHSYIKPCTDKSKAACQNYQHLQSRGKK